MTSRGEAVGIGLRRRLGALGLAACCLVPGAGAAQHGSAPSTPAETGDDETRFVSRARQLTFEGRRAGEGYFSPDGSRMVFQSEREPGNPFFQIYELSLEDGEVRRVSTGAGKTTCAFFHPKDGRILFGSTHHDPRSEEYQKAELDFRASGKKRRYDWDFDPEMELYVAAGSGPPRRLTEARGYDAEGSYSPDGKWIVFTSTRQAYGRELSAEEQQRLEIDPSYFAEIYSMRSDGSKLRRLTETPGYDGGPFFSPDGKRIVWRRFDPDGAIADLWSMRPDGSDKHRITDFGSMSWAPFYHPSGEYVFFTSNKLGFENFELFIVDAEGRKEPVRVTYTPGFDGLPVPAPGGRELSWTSNRRGGGAQIMLARWDHERALEALSDAPLRKPASEGGQEE